MNALAPHPHVHGYVTIPVNIVRPAMSFSGPCFAISHVPTHPITIGLRVLLEVRYVDAAGRVVIAVETGVWGTIFAVESLSTDHIEFVIQNEAPTGQPFAYLLVPGFRHGFVHMPIQFYDAWSYLRPFLGCTLWPQRARTTVHVAMPAGVYLTGSTAVAELRENPPTATSERAITEEDGEVETTTALSASTNSSTMETHLGSSETPELRQGEGPSMGTHLRRLSAFWDRRFATEDGDCVAKDTVGDVGDAEDSGAHEQIVSTE